MQNYTTWIDSSAPGTSDCSQEGGYSQHGLYSSFLHIIPDLSADSVLVLSAFKPGYSGSSINKGT